MCNLPAQISHGGSQGFKSPHLHPQPRRSERRQRRAGDAHRVPGPRWARGRSRNSSRRGVLVKLAGKEMASVSEAVGPFPAVTRSGYWCPAWAAGAERTADGTDGQAQKAAGGAQ
jgi:hypothetical protein